MHRASGRKVELTPAKASAGVGGLLTARTDRTSTWRGRVDAWSCATSVCRGRRPFRALCAGDGHLRRSVAGEPAGVGSFRTQDRSAFLRSVADLNGLRLEHPSPDTWRLVRPSGVRDGRGSWPVPRLTRQSSFVRTGNSMVIRTWPSSRPPPFAGRPSPADRPGSHLRHRQPAAGRRPRLQTRPRGQRTAWPSRRRSPPAAGPRVVRGATSFETALAQMLQGTGPGLSDRRRRRGRGHAPREGSPSVAGGDPASADGRRACARGRREVGEVIVTVQKPAGRCRTVPIATRAPWTASTIENALRLDNLQRRLAASRPACWSPPSAP